MRRRAMGGFLALGLSLGALGDPAGAYEQRSGTFSMGLQGQVAGLLAGEGDFGAFELRTDDGFKGAAPGISVLFRLAIDRSSAIGVTFEALNFKRSLPAGEVADFEEATSDTADKVHVTVFSADYYRYFWRRGKQTPYLVAGIGFYRPEIRFGEVATRFPGSNLSLNGGIGFEHFFTRSVSLDLTTRVHGLFHDSGPSIAGELAIGLRFYHLSGRRRR